MRGLIFQFLTNPPGGGHTRVESPVLPSLSDPAGGENRIASRLNIGLGLAVILVVGLDTRCARERAVGVRMVVSESGMRLPSIFAGIAANPRLYEVASMPARQAGPCLQKKLGPWNRIAGWFSIRSVSAQSCTPSSCSGAYFVGQTLSCGPGCSGTYESDYSDGWGTNECSGYEYTGGSTCPNCQNGSCTTKLCQVEGCGGGGGGCDSDPCALDCGGDGCVL